jgi:hypothetical protein
MAGCGFNEARYQRRKAAREAKRNDRLKHYDDFNRIIDTDNLCASFNRSKCGVSWKKSVQWYGANTMLERHIPDRRVIALTCGFVSVFGPGKSLGLGSQVSQAAAIFYPGAAHGQAV